MTIMLLFILKIWLFVRLRCLELLYHLQPVKKKVKKVKKVMKVMKVLKVLKVLKSLKIKILEISLLNLRIKKDK